VLLGGCHSAEPDIVHVYVHNIALNRSYHSNVMCAACCPRAPTMMHAFLDLVQGSLHIVAPAAGSASAHRMHSVLFENWDIEHKMDSVAGNAGPAAFSHYLLLGATPGLSGAANGTLTVRLLGPAVLTALLRWRRTRRGCICRVRAASRTRACLRCGRTLRRRGARSGCTTPRAQAQRAQPWCWSTSKPSARRSARSCCASISGPRPWRPFELLAADFALLNAWDFDTVALEQALPPALYVVVACATANAADARLFVHVQVDVRDDVVVTLTVMVLGAHAMLGQTGTSHFAHVLALRSAHEEHHNVVVAVSHLVEVHRADLLHTLKVMQVQCVACSDDDGRIYELGEDKCSCGAGSISVCVPCVDAYACSVKRFTFDSATMRGGVNCSVRPRARADAAAAAAVLDK